jgi:hypothetical protein
MTVNQNSSGITTNPFRIIQATDKLGPDAEIAPNSRATHGLVASVSGPNKIIMDTGYFPANELVGAHHIEVQWFAIDPTGYRYLNSYTAELEYWVLDVNGNETNPLTVPLASNGIVDPMSFALAPPVSLSANNQYRFIVRSIPGTYLAYTDQISVDYIKIQVEDMGKVSGEGYANLGLVSIPTMVTGDNTNYTFSTVVTAGGMQLASIIPASPNPNLIASITNKTVTGFTLTLTHRSGTNWTGTYIVDILIMQSVYVQPI